MCLSFLKGSIIIYMLHYLIYMWLLYNNMLHPSQCNFSKVPCVFDHISPEYTYYLYGRDRRSWSWTDHLFSTFTNSGGRGKLGSSLVHGDTVLLLQGVGTGGIVPFLSLLLPPLLLQLRPRQDPEASNPHPTGSDEPKKPGWLCSVISLVMEFDPLGVALSKNQVLWWLQLVIQVALC